MSCRCADDPRVAAFLKRYGAVRAAEMHSRPEIKTDDGLEWRIHMDEEDFALRPFIERHFQCLLSVYDADHQAFTVQIAKYGKIVDLARLKAHAQMEEWIILQLIAKGY